MKATAQYFSVVVFDMLYISKQYEKETNRRKHIHTT